MTAAAAPRPTLDPPPGTVLYRGGRVYSPTDPRATALLVEGGSVGWIGTDSAAEALSADTVVELDGALVTPAFVDAHVHTTQTGLALTGLDLAGAVSLDDLLDRVARATRPGEPLLGHGWDDSGWPQRRAPSAAELDRATGGAIVYLSRVDAHSAAVSSALLAACPGVETLAGHSPGGPVSLDANAAVRQVAFGAVTAAQRTARQRATRARAAELGIGALHECGGPTIAGEDDFAALLALAAEEPGPDVFGYWGELGGQARARELGAVGAGGDLFADGSLGSRTACLREPYTDAPEPASASRGHAYLDAGQVAEHLVGCAELDLQGGFHAIGDAALDAVLAGFVLAAERIGLERVRAGRHRIEHAEVLDRRLVAGLVEHGVVASVQPAFDAAWGGEDGLYARRLGVERALTLNPFGTLAGVGVPMAFGSDSPVTPLDPWGGVRAAAHHRTPTQRISVRAGFAASTRGGWRALRRDEEGVLAPGAPATLAVWSLPASADAVGVQVPDERVARWTTDPRAAVPGLPDLDPGVALPTCVRTLVRGRAVFDAGALPGARP